MISPRRTRTRCPKHGSDRYTEADEPRRERPRGRPQLRHPPTLAREAQTSEDFAEVSETATATAQAIEVSDSKLIAHRY